MCERLPVSNQVAGRGRSWFALLLAASFCGDWAAAGAEPAERKHSSGRPLPTMPEIRQAVSFDTPEADRIFSALQVFPADNPWNQDVSKWPVHPHSHAIIDSIGAQKPLRYNADMATIIVPPGHPRTRLKVVEYPDESDPGPYPIPDSTPIEGWPANYRRDPAWRDVTLDQVQRDSRGQGGDRHAIVVDPSAGVLYEFFGMRKVDGGWTASQASIFDLKTNRLRPDGWTSADAAGLPIFPAVIRFDELQRGEVEHAMRVTVRRTRRAYVAPATHFASRLTDPNLPRMGERLRLRADFDVRPFPPEVQAILKGLKRYGMLVADNGIEWALSCASDERIPVLHEPLRRVKGSDFEVVEAPR